MSQTPAIVVEPFQDAHLDDVIRIHRAGLAYSLNSQLGTEHLAFLYRGMARDPECYVGVALEGGRPVGIVSGAIDAGALRSRMIRSLSLARFARLASRFLTTPRLVTDLWKENVIASPVQHIDGKVASVLTAIAVDGSLRGRGVGRQLVVALEQFFASRAVRCYRLDTLSTNSGATAFYRQMGFLKVAERAGSLILVKTIEPAG